MMRDALIRTLKEDIAQSRVVIIAGTGVSIAACGNQKIDGYPVASWVGLLQHGLEYCRHLGVADDNDAKTIGVLIESEKTDFLVAAAETISQRLQSRSAGIFRGWLTSTVGALEPQDYEILDALASLPGVLATLNYDDLLGKVPRREHVTWLRPDKVQNVLQGKLTNAVLHLHGYFDEPESVVLGLSSYGRVAGHTHTRAVLQLFTIDRTLMFVGCGGTVKDPNFSRLIEWAGEALEDVPARHVMLCREEELGAIRADLASAPWLQPLAYGKDYKELVPFLRSLAPLGQVQPPKPLIPGPAVSLDFDSYRKAMRNFYGGLKLEAVDPTTHDIRPLKLTGMFIAQNAREYAEFIPRVFELPKELQRRLRQGELKGVELGAELDEETLAQYSSAFTNQSTRPVLEVVNDPACNHLVILGDPGSGKSTLLQYLLLLWADKGAPNLKDDPLPLLIELSEYARLRHDGRITDFLEYLQSGASVRWQFDRELLGSWLRDNPSIMLFDGLDEVFEPKLLKEVVPAIHRFADKYPAARVIITSRIVGYQHQPWRDAGFRQFVLQELEDSQIDDFLVRWHRNAYDDPLRRDTKRRILARAILDSSAIRQLAGNPLLLTMMAILNRTQDLPRDRVRLYEKCAELLLHQWKSQGELEANEILRGAMLDFTDMRKLLLRVAGVVQTSEHGLASNLIDESALEAALAQGLTGIHNLRPERVARALIEQLRMRNFMLCYVGGRSYAFVHHTFLEYFCALEIAERFEKYRTLTIEQLKRQFFARWEEESWHEVLCLLAGMLAPSSVREVLNYVIQQPDPWQTCHAIFLSARCVGQVRRRNELGPIRDEVFRRVKAIGEAAKVSRFAPVQ